MERKATLIIREEQNIEKFHLLSLLSCLWVYILGLVLVRRARICRLNRDYFRRSDVVFFLLDSLVVSIFASFCVEGEVWSALWSLLNGALVGVWVSVVERHSNFALYSVCALLPLVLLRIHISFAQKQGLSLPETLSPVWLAYISFRGTLLRGRSLSSKGSTREMFIV